MAACGYLAILQHGVEPFGCFDVLDDSKRAVGASAF